jgi:hypothetical protein
VVHQSGVGFRRDTREGSAMWSKAIGAASVLRATAPAIFPIGVGSGPAGASANASLEGVPSFGDVS